MRIEDLTGITVKEVQALKESGIATTEDLRARLDYDKPELFEKLETSTKIGRGRLLAWITSGLFEPTSLLDYPRVRRLPSWLAGVFLIVLVFGPLLAARLGLPLALPGGQKALLTAREMRKDHVLAAADVYAVEVPRSRDVFTEEIQVAGLVLAHDLLPNKPLQYSDVLRPQVVAANDLDTDTVITREAVSLDWTVYDPQAALTFEQVLGRNLSSPVKKGQIVALSKLADEASLVQQVVVVKEKGLPALRTIKAGDVELRATTPDDEAYNDLGPVVGSLLLEAVSSGHVVTQKQLISQEEMSGRVVFSLKLESPANPTVEPGDLAQLYFVPATADDSTGTIQTFSDVILLAHDSARTSITIAFPEKQLRTLLRLLTTHKAYIIEPGPVKE